VRNVGYNNTISEPSSPDQGTVHLEHYKNDQRHCFVRDYDGTSNGKRYIGICHMFFDEITES